MEGFRGAAESAIDGIAEGFAQVCGGVIHLGAETHLVQDKVLGREPVPELLAEGQPRQIDLPHDGRPDLPVCVEERADEMVGAVDRHAEVHGPAPRRDGAERSDEAQAEDGRALITDRSLPCGGASRGTSRALGEYETARADPWRSWSR
jgi:hypothetical protein